MQEERQLKKGKARNEKQLKLKQKNHAKPCGRCGALTHKTARSRLCPFNSKYVKLDSPAVAVITSPVVATPKRFGGKSPRFPIAKPPAATPEAKMATPTPETTLKFQVDQMVYAKWKDDNNYYPAQILSVNNSNHYKVFFMDGYSENDVPESDLRVVPERIVKKHSQWFGRKFYDSNPDNSPNFKPGVYTVLCHQPGGNYWCERVTDEILDSRDIKEFDCEYTIHLIKKYETIKGAKQVE